jgi:hypothetical protein
LTSLKQRRLCTATAAPTFTADRGYVFNGTTQYLRTGYVPSTTAVALTGSDMRIGVYERTNLAATTCRAGINEATTRGLLVENRTATSGVGAQLNCTLHTIAAAAVTDSRGLTTVARSAGPVFTAYKNGVSVGVGAPGANATVLPVNEIYIGAADNGGAATLFCACSLGFVVVGASLTPAQELAHYNNVQTWATAVGANV